MLDISSIKAALASVADPLVKDNIIGSGRAAAPRLDGGRVSLVLDVTGLTRPQRDSLDAAVEVALKNLEGVAEIRVALTSAKTNRTMIAIASGKGGVGKSTLAANVAVALARIGHKVGLVDADIYGPSQPRLMHVEGIKPEALDKRLIPVPTPYGVPLLSIGQLVKPTQAIAWRGPMAGNALSQLIDADWGETDVLIIDLPPGTGDVQLSMIQKHKPSAAIIVSTPQDLALMDAVRAIDLFNTAGVPIMGLVENMAGYSCPHCGVPSDPFGNGGAEAAAAQLGIAFLGRIPLDIAIRIASDAGAPPAHDDNPVGVAFSPIAAQISAWLTSQPAASLPKL